MIMANSYINPVIPSKEGIQDLRQLDSRLRGSDN
jgi:hypothetical protein